MRISVIIAALALVVLGTQPVLADEARDYIDDEVAEWTDIAVGRGYNVLGTYIGMIGSEDVVYTFDLAPGLYRFYASGGLRIDDLDVYIYDSEGMELGADALPDKIPIIAFELGERTEIEVRIEAWAFQMGYNSGFFCFLVTCADEGEIFEFTGETTSATEGPPPVGPVADGSDEEFLQELESTFESWTSMELELGGEVIDSDIVAVDASGLSLSYDLDAGFYYVQATTDSRCADLDISVYDENGDTIADDHLADNFPICDFYIQDAQEITIDFEVFEMFEGFDETYLAYLLSNQGGMSIDDRNDHILNELDWLTLVSEGAGEEVLDTKVDILTKRDPTAVLEYDLEEGNYYCQAIGGLAVTNLDMAVYDESGDLLGEDTLDDIYPLVWLELSGPETVTVEITAVDFIEGFDDGYFCWVLTNVTDTYSGWDEAVDDQWEFADSELMENAELMADIWMASIERHNEEIIETFTEQLEGQNPENGWEYELDLEEGVYYFYAAGDELCITDLDMVIYGEDGMIVGEDYAWTNFPVCSLEVGRRGGTYLVNVNAYWMEYDIGYFHLIITREL